MIKDKDKMSFFQETEKHVHSRTTRSADALTRLSVKTTLIDILATAVYGKHIKDTVYCKDDSLNNIIVIIEDKLRAIDGCEHGKNYYETALRGCSINRDLQRGIERCPNCREEL